MPLFDVFIALAMLLCMITARVPIDMQHDSIFFSVRPYWYFFSACVMVGIKIYITRPIRFSSVFFGGGGFEITEFQSLLLGIIFAALGLIVLILGLMCYT